MVQFEVPKYNSQIFQLQQKAVHYLQGNKSKSQKKSSVQSVLTGTHDYVRVHFFPLQLSSCSCVNFACMLLATAVKNYIQVVELAFSVTMTDSPGVHWEASQTLFICAMPTRALKLFWQALNGLSVMFQIITPLYLNHGHQLRILGGHTCAHTMCYGVTIPCFWVMSVQHHCYKVDFEVPLVCLSGFS